MRYPLENPLPRISSTFGYRTDPKSGARKMHNGIDYAAKHGQAIYAIEDGVVIESRVSTAPNGGYGEYIKIQHPNGDASLYAHMVEGSRLVKKGDRVVEGQQIGKVGSTGYSTGDHLHWEVLVNGSPVNPVQYVINRQKSDPPKPPVKHRAPAPQKPVAAPVSPVETKATPKPTAAPKKPAKPRTAPKKGTQS